MIFLASHSVPWKTSQRYRKHNECDKNHVQTPKNLISINSIPLLDCFMHSHSPTRHHPRIYNWSSSNGWCINYTRMTNGSLSGVSLDGGLETVVESSRHVLQVRHSAGTGSSSSLGLQSPVVGSHLGSRVTARRTGLLLSVERTTATSLTQNVRLVVSLSHRWRTLWNIVSKCDFSCGKEELDMDIQYGGLTWPVFVQIWWKLDFHNRNGSTNSLITSGYDASFLRRDLCGFVCLFETLAIAMDIFRPFEHLFNRYKTGHSRSRYIHVTYSGESAWSAGRWFKGLYILPIFAVVYWWRFK
mgnify:CR=1 FL=1